MLFSIMEKLPSAVLFLSVLLLVQGFQLCLCGNSTARCIKGERQALLKLKQSFQDPSNRLVSWNGEDCCRWSGISCDKRTGQVVQLDLKTPPAYHLYGSYIEYDASEQLSASEVHSCLVELKHLEYLDLSGNYFNQSQIPKFFGSFKHLKYLNVSHAGLGGKIPHELGNISGLQALDLSTFQDSTPQLYADKFQWVSSLQSLQHLSMNGVDLSNALDLIEVLRTLPSLLHLGLHYCGIQNIHFSRGYANSSFLASVQFLDISHNMLDGAIPRALQNMTALRELDLSENDLNSTVPLWIVNSKSLAHLYLSENALDNIEGGLLSMLNNACSLKSLDLSRNSMSDDLLNNRNYSSKCLAYALEFLHLSDATRGGMIPDWLGELKGMKFLDLSENSLEGPIPSSLGQCSFLEVLVLSANHLNDSIPESLGRLSLLRELNLESNQLSGTIPEILGSLSTLEDLVLSENHLKGTIPSSLGNLSFLRNLDLSQNQLAGLIPQSLESLIHLEDLDLSNNLLNGSITHSIGRLSSLTSLDLSRNKLSGFVPIGLGHLANLSKLDISSNFLEGIISEPHFSNLSLLLELNISSNHLSIKVKSDWNPPFKLNILDMSSCSIGSQFPRWLHNQTEFGIINLSNTNISGSFPTFRITGGTLDLSRNQISGNLPMNNVDVAYLHLESNLLNGSIPDSICGLSLHILDLSRNNLSGEIPQCFGSLQVLAVLVLSFNKLSGSIPTSIGDILTLVQLRLNDNSLDGELPLALRNSTYLSVLDVGENRITGTIPTWIGESLKELKILRLRKNKFSGNIPVQLCRLSELQILDLALNNLSGGIPHCFNNFTHMSQHDTGLAPRGFLFPDNYADSGFDQVEVAQVIKGMELEYAKKQLQLLFTIDLSANKLVGTIPEELGTLAGLRSLNLSHNHLSGNIPNKIGGLESIESLDLSNNQLFGEIPQGIAALMSLNYLNLSNNILSGKFPTGNQLQTLNNPSIYAGNLQLCGAPLPKKCPGEDEPTKPPINSENEGEGDGEDKKDEILFWFTVAAGYITGLWGVIGTLVLKKNWRITYFQIADDAKEWILMMVAVKLARLKQRMQRTVAEE